VRGILKLVFLAIFLAATPMRAEEADPLARVDPATLQAARDGSGEAAFNVGTALIDPWTEPNLRAALPWFEQAYAAADVIATTDPVLAAQTAIMLSRVLAGVSEHRKALDLAAEAQRRFEAWAAVTPDANPYYIAMTLEDQAILLTELSRYEESIPYLERAREIYDSIGSQSSVANAWLNQGISLEGANQLDAALDAYYRSYQIFDSLDAGEGPEVGYLANNIGWVLHRQKNYTEARHWFEGALERVQYYEGEFSYNVMKIYVNLGIVAQGEGKPDEAIRWGMKAMPFMSDNRTQTLEDQRWNFENMSRAFAAKGNADKAIFFGKMAVNAQQEFRASNTVTGAADLEASQREWGRLYEDLADLLIAQGRISEAQAVLNMANEEEVFQFLKRDSSAKLTETRSELTQAEAVHQDTLVSIVAPPVAAEQELQALMVKFDAGEATPEEENRIFELQDTLQAASDEFDAAVDAFLAAMPETDRAVLDDQFDAVGSYQAVLADLPRPTAILQVAALDNATHLFLTLPGLTLHEEVLLPKADLARLVFDALESIETVSPDAKDKLAALYAVIFAPVDQALRDSGTQVVMLNLDGVLRYVPFAALYDGQGYLVERYAFALYSTAVPTQFETAPRAPKATAGFGVTQAHEGFSALPGVAKELDTIFGGASAVLAGETELDADFDERSLKRALLGKPTILHIASHFNLVPGREDDSFLLLGDGEHLPLSKIRSTRALRFTGVDLLTLSACQTARGGDGSEIDGFGATAQLNGAGAVMASLWPVSDQATPMLMHGFYDGMIAQGLDKAEALRRSQVAMLKGSGDAVQLAARAAAPLEGEAAPAPAGPEHPYFWAAFVLMGNWL
jgi:CHAT domain-containing protein/Tfp pilus assembly protein PilF